MIISAGIIIIFMLLILLYSENGRRLHAEQELEEAKKFCERLWDDVTRLSDMLAECEAKKQELQTKAKEVE